MTLVEQTITINGGRVSFHVDAPAPASTTPRGFRRPRREVVGNEHLVTAVDELRQNLDTGPERVEFSAKDDVVVPAAGLDGGMVGLQPDLDLLESAQSAQNDVSSAVASDAVAAAARVEPTVGEHARDKVPGHRPVVSSVPAGVSPLPAGAPTPYFHDGTVTVYHGNCLELLEVWRDAAVLITDPPYGLQGLAGAYGTGHRTIANDTDTRVRDAVLDIWGDRPAAVFGSPRLEEPPGGWSDRLVWDKGQLGLNGGAWRYAHESIFVRGDGWRRLNDSASSILRYSSQANRRNVAKHIHSKPVPLIAQLVASAPPGLIVDPFGGGGATAVACATLGRPVVIIEVELEHCETIVARLQQQTFDFGVIE